jgi:putative FmdB family regulatory protein
MPIYDYRCTVCQRWLEVFHKIDEAIDVECPECGAEARKQFSAHQTFRFYGDGTYQKHEKGD